QGEGTVLVDGGAVVGRASGRGRVVLDCDGGRGAGPGDAGAGVVVGGGHADGVEVLAGPGGVVVRVVGLGCDGEAVGRHCGHGQRGRRAGGRADGLADGQRAGLGHAEAAGALGAGATAAPVDRHRLAVLGAHIRNGGGQGEGTVLVDGGA